MWDRLESRINQIRDAQKESITGKLIDCNVVCSSIGLIFSKFSSGKWTFGVGTVISMNSQAVVLTAAHLVFEKLGSLELTRQFYVRNVLGKLEFSKLVEGMVDAVVFLSGCISNCICNVVKLAR